MKVSYGTHNLHRSVNNHKIYVCFDEIFTGNEFESTQPNQFRTGEILHFSTSVVQKSTILRERNYFCGRVLFHFATERNRVQTVI
jgi:hypothetical protein